MLTESSRRTYAWLLERCLSDPQVRQMSHDVGSVRDVGYFDGQAVLQHRTTCAAVHQGLPLRGQMPRWKVAL